MRETILKIILAPLSILYGIGVYINNLAYKYGLLQSTKFDIPTICIGNLTIGGAGKTPHVEFLIRYLRQYIKVATLSRGYKRKIPGFLVVEAGNNAAEVGDEPIQFKRKYRDVMVAVSEDRTFAIPKMLMHQPRLQAVLLDDAFQHQALEAGMNILLTEYAYPFMRDYPLPSGRLRDLRSSYKRADIIVASKCPVIFTEQDRAEFIEEVNLLDHQEIFFSYYRYGHPYYLFNGSQRFALSEDLDVLLVSGIAKPEYLVDYLETVCNAIHNMEFADHHFFSNSDVGRIKGRFTDISSNKKVIITTEKDAVRLDLHREYLLENKLPVFVLPIEVNFHFNEGDKFRSSIKDFLLDFKV